MRFLLGVVVGVMLTLLFLQLGGPKFLKRFGEKATRWGEKMERYERLLKETLPSEDQTRQ